MKRFSIFAPASFVDTFSPTPPSLSLSFSFPLPSLILKYREIYSLTLLNLSVIRVFNVNPCTIYTHSLGFSYAKRRPLEMFLSSVYPYRNHYGWELNRDANCTPFDAKLKFDCCRGCSLRSNGSISNGSVPNGSRYKCKRAGYVYR